MPERCHLFADVLAELRDRCLSLLDLAALDPVRELIEQQRDNGQLLDRAVMKGSRKVDPLAFDERLACVCDRLRVSHLKEIIGRTRVSTRTESGRDRYPYLAEFSAEKR